MSDRNPRTATFRSDCQALKVWLTPNSFGIRNCTTIEQARQLIAETGVAQKLIDADSPTPR